MLNVIDKDTMRTDAPAERYDTRLARRASDADSAARHRA